MNKRNFGRVIKAIEADPRKWDQNWEPDICRPRPTCKTPFCFLGHAEFIRLGRVPFSCLPNLQFNPDLAEWLGLTEYELEKCFHWENTLADFKRWHKQGRVS